MSLWTISAQPLKRRSYDKPLDVVKTARVCPNIVLNAGFLAPDNAALGNGRREGEGFHMQRVQQKSVQASSLITVDWVVLMAILFGIGAAVLASVSTGVWVTPGDVTPPI